MNMLIRTVRNRSSLNGVDRIHELIEAVHTESAGRLSGTRLFDGGAGSGVGRAVRRIHQQCLDIVVKAAVLAAGVLAEAFHKPRVEAERREFACSGFHNAYDSDLYRKYITFV